MQCIFCIRNTEVSTGLRTRIPKTEMAQKATSFGTTLRTMLYLSSKSISSCRFLILQILHPAVCMKLPHRRWTIIFQYRETLLSNIALKSCVLLTSFQGILQRHHSHHVNLGRS
jgi:hypothetical protein